jgi:hypothetical protein
LLPPRIAKLDLSATVRLILLLESEPIGLTDYSIYHTCLFTSEPELIYDWQ